MSPATCPNCHNDGSWCPKCCPQPGVRTSNLSDDWKQAAERYERGAANAGADIERTTDSAGKMYRAGRALLQLLTDCEPYLKEDESPAACIQRNRDDANAVLGLLAKEKQIVESLRGNKQPAIETIYEFHRSEDGRHIYDDDFEFDVRMDIDGDWPSDEARIKYADMVVAALNAVRRTHETCEQLMSGLTESQREQATENLLTIIDVSSALEKKTPKELVDLVLGELAAMDVSSVQELLIEELCTRVHPNWCNEESGEPPTQKALVCSICHQPIPTAPHQPWCSENKAARRP